MTPIIGAQRKVRKPIGEALPNQEIFGGWRRRWATRNPSCSRPTRSSSNAWLDQMEVGLTHEQLAERGHVYLSDTPFDFFAEHGFPTRSGRIEIASTKAERAGLSRLPEPSVDDRPPPGRFRLLSPASRWRLNDSHANDPTIARRSGPAAVTIHPDDASTLGIDHGDRVRPAQRRRPARAAGRRRGGRAPGCARESQGTDGPSSSRAATT